MFVYGHKRNRCLKGSMLNNIPVGKTAHYIFYGLAYTETLLT